MILKFLKAKHWQLFLLMFGLPFIFQITFMISAFSSITSDPNSSPQPDLSMLGFFPLIMIVFMGTFFGWFWSIAIGLQNRIPEQIKMKVKKFKILFFFPLVYMLTIFSTMLIAFTGVFESETNESARLIFSFAAVIIPLHLFSMFCIFYSLYFVSKTIKTVELQRAVSFSDFAGEFFLLWFYPIGIWIVQPKINAFVKDQIEHPSLSPKEDDVE